MPPDSLDAWWPVARSSDVTTQPMAVRVNEREWVAVRLVADGAVSVLEARCPHRLANLSYGTVVDGNLQCPYHGWQFDGDGACAVIPSYGPGHAVPERAHLLVPWGVREHDGWVWVAVAEPGTDVGPDLRAIGETLTNLDHSMLAGWHPVALISELPPATGPDELVAAPTHSVRLLGREYSVMRHPDGSLSAAEAAGEPAAVDERFGVVWVAPKAPYRALIECADDTDPLFSPGWLPPERSTSAAGLLAENFLDVAHFPFVHSGTFGAAEEPQVPAFDVVIHEDGGGLSSTQEQWFDNPEDPGVISGIRPMRQRRRATYTYRWPMQLILTLEELDAGAVKTILFFLQPEDLGSTRVYTKMLLHGIGGVAVPDADVVEREVAFEMAVLAEDLVLQRAMTVDGLPLRLRDELHVRSDRSGVALRRILADHLSA
jgi:phenylpropionate dioxygenase-like ring-hydroxylating dioxygenase large terminal subunit